MQHAPATDTGSQEVINASGIGCCGGASVVEGETSQTTAGGCCGTPASETARSDNVLPQVQTEETSDTGKTASQAPQTDDTDTDGCGCGSQ